jgi:hypothetical protein
MQNSTNPKLTPAYISGLVQADEGLQQIIDLAYNMNKEGKGRRLTKEEFIQNRGG